MMTPRIAAVSAARRAEDDGPVAHAATRWPLPRIGLLAVIALAMWGIKRHYASADVADLGWILKPVASLTALVTGATFEWEAGSGYLCRERFFVIAKPCAGVNFLLAAFGMVGFLLSERVRSLRAGAGLAAVSLMLAYLAAVFANTLRITVALALAAHPSNSEWLTAGRLHRLEGVVVYFGTLALLRLVVQRFMDYKHTAPGDSRVSWSQGRPSWLEL
jgi:exosortase K